MTEANAGSDSLGYRPQRPSATLAESPLRKFNWLARRPTFDRPQFDTILRAGRGRLGVRPKGCIHCQIQQLQASFNRQHHSMLLSFGCGIPLDDLQRDFRVLVVVAGMRSHPA